LSSVRLSRAFLRNESIKETVFRLRGHGWSEQRIAERVGLPAAEVAAIQTMRDFTQEQDKVILEMRNQKGRFWKAIAEALGGTFSTDDIRIRHAYLMRVQLLGSRAPKSGFRTCLGNCGRQFFSEDLVRTRQCEDCFKRACATGYGDSLGGSEGLTRSRSGTGSSFL